jgi:hypothetical protein
MEYRLLTNIEDMGHSYAADNDELVVSRDKGQPIIAILLFGLVIVYGFYLAFFKNSSTYIKIGVITATILFIWLIAGDPRKPNPILTINAAGIYLYGKDHYEWTAIREIVYETDEDGKGSPFLVLYLHNGEKASFDASGYLNQPMDAIAAYINKYWRRSGE